MVKEGFSDDLHYAKRVASKLGAKLNVLDAEPNILNDFDKMIWHLDEPQADPAAIHVLNISKGARDLGIKVLLGGTAGDDIFTGYRRHLALNYEPFIQGSPLFLRKLLAYVADSLNSTHPKVRRLKKISRELPLDPSDRMAGYFAWLPSKDVFGLFNTEISSMLSLENISTGYYKHLLGKIPMEKDKVNQMLFLEMSTFLTNHNLNYTDKMSMAVGVETRVPYLDINVVNLSARIPSSLKLKGNTTKYLLKKVAEKYLPKDVVYRPKTGFGAPVREWVKNDLSEMISDRLSEQTIKKRGFLSGSAVNRLLKKNREGQEDNAYPIMALLAIESWFEQFIDR
jgi:asparagine synthase (glutamine-hydrolysing)